MQLHTTKMGTSSEGARYQTVDGLITLANTTRHTVSTIECLHRFWMFKLRMHAALSADGISMS